MNLCRQQLQERRSDVLRKHSEDPPRKVHATRALSNAYPRLPTRDDLMRALAYTCPYFHLPSGNRPRGFCNLGGPYILYIGGVMEGEYN